MANKIQKITQSRAEVQRILNESDGLRRQVESELATLKGEGEGSVSAAVEAGVRRVLGGASEAYDTLKEIEDYIKKDEAGAVTLSQSITRLETEKVSKQDVDSSLSITSENPVQNKAVTKELGNKVDKEEGKGLSTNDYTDEDKEKVSYGGAVISDEDSLWDAATKGSKYGPIVNFTDPENDTAMLNGVYHIVDFSVNPTPYIRFIAIVNDDWTGDIYLMNIDYDRAYSNYSITRKNVNSILTAEQFATQAEIDAIFDGNSGGTSSSY